jgi:NADPH:quinone reductase-like Zn-dependent oxidoreductase
MQKDFDTLRLVTRPPPNVGPGQALVAVRASAINARDLGIATGRFMTRKRETLVPLSDGAGDVLAVGEGVSGVQPGDRVIATHFPEWLDGPWDPAYYGADIGNSLDGWLAEKVLMPAAALVRIPGELSHEEACTLPVAGVTAWHALYDVARLRPGQTVLTLGTGGVSTFGLQLARAGGARVVVTSSSDAKLARMRELGAAFTVNYATNPEWGQEVLRLTGGVDVVLENVGRATLDQSLNACAPNAWVVLIGTGPLPAQLPKLPGFYQKNITMRAISNGSRRMYVELAAALAANGVRPVIDRTFPFAKAPEAFRFMASSSHIGKVVIRHGPARP